MTELGVDWVRGRGAQGVAAARDLSRLGQGVGRGLARDWLSRVGRARKTKRVLRPRGMGALRVREEGRAAGLGLRALCTGSGSKAPCA